MSYYIIKQMKEEYLFMKTAGIILLVLQAIGLIGSILNGQFSDMFTAFNLFSFAELLGFCLPGIIGAILLVIGLKKGKKKSSKETK